MPVQQVLQSMRPKTTTTTVQPSSAMKPSIFVAGSIAVDLLCDYMPSYSSLATAPLPRTSNPASVQQSIGGVGHNVATAAHLASSPGSVRLCTVVADDLAGNLVMSSLKERGLDTTGIKVLPAKEWRTAQYIAVNDTNKDLVLAMADMDIVGSPNHELSGTWTTMLEDSAPKWLIVDGNWHPSVLKHWARAGKASGSKVAFEPVSIEKSARLFPSKASLLQAGLPQARTFPNQDVDLASPNEYELEAMHQAAKANDYFESEDWWNVIDSLGIPSSGARVQMVHLTSKQLVDRGIAQMAVQLLPFLTTILTKLGPNGLLVTRLLASNDPALTNLEDAPYILSRCSNGSTEVGGVYMRLYAPTELVPKDDVVSVNGIGDTFLGVMIAGLSKGMKLDGKLIDIAQRAAVMTLKSKESVHPGIAILAKDLVTVSF